MKCLASKRRIRRRDGVEPRRHARPTLGDSLPAVRGRGSDLDWPRCCCLGRSRRQGHDLVVRRAAHRIACRIRVVGRSLAAGALSQDAAKPQENEHCERQEDDGVDIEHVSYLSASRMAGRYIPRAARSDESAGGAKSPLYVGTRGEPSSGRCPIRMPTLRLNDRRRRANIVSNGRNRSRLCRSHAAAAAVCHSSMTYF